MAMSWRAAYSLVAFHRQLQLEVPDARPPATGADEWGLIGDAAHDPTSDHTPHNFPGWGLQIVTAADFPNRPDLGLNAHTVLDNIRRSKDVRVKYGISNGQMFSSYQSGNYEPFTWRPYNPKNGDKHFTHGHLSVVGDVRADNTAPWHTGLSTVEDDDMGYSQTYDIQPNGEFTSHTLAPVLGGLADPRPQWISFCNDLGDSTLDLRVWFANGAGVYTPLKGFENGIVRMHSGVRYGGYEIPAGCSGVSLWRASLYDGHATFVIEHGAMVH